ncbi:hypothetical protein C5N14_16835 [Micromonospora sp. MW-13]|nr:hypothetical protein C5N14_16835 [Micromonospora sp. MW-13]
MLLRYVVSPNWSRLPVLRSQLPSFLGRCQAIDTKPEQSGRYLCPSPSDLAFA